MNAARSLRLGACALLAALALACGARTQLAELDPDASSDAQPACVPSAELCNGRDDDCNGLIDDGLSFGPLGAPAELREGQGDTGPCTSCRWAWDPVLAPQSGGGLLALWWLGIYGGAERPNLWARALGADGTPQGAPRLLSSDVVMDQQTLTPNTLPGGDTLLGASLRVGTSDLPGLVRVHAGGSLTVTRLPSVRCRVPGSLVGSRVLCASYGTDALTTASTATDGTDVTTSATPMPGLALVVLGSYGDRAAALLYSVSGGARTLSWVGLTPRGALLGPPRALPLVYESYPRLLGTSEGWLVVMPGTASTPARFARLDTAGAVLEGLQAWPDGHRLDDSSLVSVFAHHPSARQLVSFHQDMSNPRAGAMVVELLDERAAVLASWTGLAPGSGTVASPAVHFASDRLLLSWHDIAADSSANRVYVQPFGCVP